MRDSDKSMRDSDKIARQERLAALRLIRSENLGPINYRRLIERFGSPTAALDALPELARRVGGRRSIKLCPLEKAEAELTALKDLGAIPVTLGEPAYPAALAAIEDLDVVEFLPRGRTLSTSNVLSLMLRGSYKAYRVWTTGRDG